MNYWSIKTMFKLSTESNDRVRLIGGLKYQITLMLNNAELLSKVCPDLDHDVELKGAATIVQSWIEGIEDK